MKNYAEYTVILSTQPMYYGDDCTQEDAKTIVNKLEQMVRNQFPGIHVDQEATTQFSSETVGPNETTVDEIEQWIDGNWTAATTL